MDLATQKFIQTRPYVVLPISQTLSALYTVTTSSNSKDGCSKCGSYLLDGSAEIRVTRSKRKQRVLLRCCKSCGWKNSLMASEGATVPSSNDSEARTSVPSIDTKPLLPAHSKNRNRKKTGLEVLLSQNRRKETEEQTGSRNSPISGGLVAFLSGL